MHGIARRMLRAADVFEIGFDTPQIGRTRVERELRVVGIGCVLRGLRPGLVGAHQPQQLLPVAKPDLEVAILLRHDGLALEALEIGRQLAQDVLDARQVLARVAESVLGLATPFLVLRDAGGLFKKDAQLVGPGLDDAADHALADDRVRARTEARAEEDVLDVAATHGLVVDQVGRRAVARQHALDRDLPVLTPRPRRLPAGRVRVVEDQFDARAARRLALAGAVEDHVLHRLAAQLAGLRLAQHPARGIDDVGLAATVGPDHADELTGQREMRRVDERLEPRKLDLRQAHVRRIAMMDWWSAR